ncbi:DUF397 domain-containing protein [Streptomyces albidoflavus]
MTHINDASALPVTWWKSSYSDSGAQCVECGIVSPTTIAVRDSKDVHGPALLFSAAALTTFVNGVAKS